MPLPTIDFRSIRVHSGSQHRAFEELCYQLVPRMEELPDGAHLVRHGTPDAGVEFLVEIPTSDGGAVHAWQAKYLLALGNGEYQQLDDSIKTAIRAQPRLRRYTFCLPYDRPAGNSPGATSAMRRWENHVEKWRNWAKDSGLGEVEVGYVGESDLVKLLTEARHAGRAYYWFNATVLSAKWFQMRLQESLDYARPRYTPDLNIDLPIAFTFDGLGTTGAFRDRCASHLRKLRGYRSRMFDSRALAREQVAVAQALRQAEQQLDVVEQGIARALDAGLGLPGFAQLSAVSREASAHLHATRQQFAELARRLLAEESPAEAASRATAFAAERKTSERFRDADTEL